MNRTKAQKQEMVTTLQAQVAKSSTMYVTDFTGLNVAQITDLRRRLRAVGVEYVVVKNTLARRALTEQQLKDGGLEPFLAGPTALVLAGADPVGAAKQAPMAGFLGVLNGLLYSMVGALEALKEQRAAGAATQQS